MSENKKEIEKGEAKKEETENGEIEKGEAKKERSKRDIEIMEAERASPRASDDEENGLTRKKLRLSKEQSAFLEESFKEHHTLTPGRKFALAKYLNLHPRQVEVWFQNKRARTKLKQTEVDCEKRCESLTKETERDVAEKKIPLKHRFRTICVFGDSDIGKDEEFQRAAKELGITFATRNISMLYSGGVEGLKGITALAASIRGSRVVSILVRGIQDRVFSLGSEVRVPTLPARLGHMFHYAETCIALPGGLEALEGFFNVAFWASLNIHRKPLGLLNINGFYDGLLSFLDFAVEQGFIPQEIRCTITSAPTADQLLDQLENCAPGLCPGLRQISRRLQDHSTVKPLIDQLQNRTLGPDPCKHEPNDIEHEPDTSLHL